MNGMDKFMAVEDSLDIETRKTVYNQVVGEDIPFWFYQCYKRTKTAYSSNNNMRRFWGEYIILDSESHPVSNGKIAETYVRCIKRFGIERIMYASRNTLSLDELRYLTGYGHMSMGAFVDVVLKREYDNFRTAVVLFFNNDV